MVTFLMKKFLGVIFLCLILTGKANSGPYGEGQLQLTKSIADYFIKYIRGKYTKKPSDFYVTLDGTDATYWTCGEGVCKSGNAYEDIKHCEKFTGKKCKKFALRRTIKWKNGINVGKGKSSKVSGRVSFDELKARLTELGFVGSASSKNTKKIVKQYELNGERSIALSWEGYSSLIAGSVNFNEADYKGTLNLSLPNGDGDCSGSYSLQSDGKGTWQIACTNDMGAAGTLKWSKIDGVTGSGRDHNDKKVKFTVAGKS